MMTMSMMIMIIMKIMKTNCQYYIDDDDNDDIVLLNKESNKQKINKIIIQLRSNFDISQLMNRVCFVCQIS